tara:strand:- start:173 stop:553 length:381 start_codon:yes stop_codon:yes gene_type:complete
MKKHSNGKIKILKYILLSESLESSFLIKYKKNTNDSNNVFYFYELKYPTNPIIDSNIIKLDSKNLSDVINSLNIYKSEFDLLDKSNKMESINFLYLNLKKFYIWLNDIKKEEVLEVVSLKSKKLIK